MAKMRPKAAKGYKHAIEFPPGEIIRSISTKKEFEVKSIIGAGGFGLIYTATLVGSSDVYVIKIEPQDNGPLFNESHVLQRIARPEIIADYIKKKTKPKLVRPLGIPTLIGNGIHEYQGGKYRFVVLPRFDVDLQKIFEDNKNCFEERTVYSVAVHLLDVLEYLDYHGYVHSDLKAANIMIGYGEKSTDEPSLFLIDYGLSSRYMSGDSHKPYKELKKNANNGTLEYTSIDAHNGVSPSRRGDLQTLGFCLWEWLAGSLPWKSIKNKDNVKATKIKCLEDLSGVPTVILKNYFQCIEKLEYDEQPDYDYLRNIFLSYLKKKGNEKLFIPTSKSKPLKTTSKSKPLKTSKSKTLKTSKSKPLKTTSKSKPMKTIENLNSNEFEPKRKRLRRK